MALYATSEEFAYWLADAPPDTADALLVRAARVVDRLARHLRYDVDTDGDPTDDTVRAALRDATCAQAQAWMDTGQADRLDPAVTDAQAVGSVKFGKVELTTVSAAQRASTAGQPPDWTTPAPAALDALRGAGLWPPAVTLA